MVLDLATSDRAWWPIGPGNEGIANDDLGPSRPCGMTAEAAHSTSMALRFLGNVAALLGLSLCGLYLAALVFLTVFQRDLLFPGTPSIIDPPGPRSIYREQTITEADSTHILIWRTQAPQKGQPTFVCFYGNASNLEVFARAGEALHREGYGVVLASYRGYSGNSGHPGEQGLMEDARAVLATVDARNGPVVLWGQSLGTGVAARMAAEGRASALVLVSPFTSVSDVAARRFPVFPVRLLMRDHFDTASLVPRIGMPVLIIHGTADDVVPYDMGKTLAQRFGKRARFVPIIGGDHILDLLTLVPTVESWWRDVGTAARRARSEQR